MPPPSTVLMLEPLDPIAVRVLGSLIEKQLTTPDNYPLTLKALVTACNQSSSRDPVMDLDEATVTRALDNLAKRTFARGVHRGDARVMRYRQEIGPTLHLHQPELAVLSVLMLRGPQTAGELKNRTMRAFDFVDLSHVEITLDSLATLSTPLATALPLAPGQREVRYAHLLAGPPVDDATEGMKAAAVGTSTPGGAATSDGARVSQSGAPASQGGAVAGAPAPAPATGRSDRLGELERDVAVLREEVASLRAELDAFRRQFE